MPARTRSRMASGVDVDGPNVHTIFARRLTALIVSRSAPIQQWPGAQSNAPAARATTVRR